MCSGSACSTRESTTQAGLLHLTLSNVYIYMTHALFLFELDNLTMLLRVVRFMRNQQLPMKLQARVLDYYMHWWNTTKGKQRSLDLEPAWVVGHRTLSFRVMQASSLSPHYVPLHLG